MPLNHDPNVILGRTKSGTLKLEADNFGLRFVCQLNKDSAQHRDIYSAIRRGDISEMSFAFTVPEGGQRFEQRPNAVPLRRLSKVNLNDVSPVVYPAYKEGTSVFARHFFDSEARSALGAALGKPIVAPQSIDEAVDMLRLRWRVLRATEQEE